MTQVSHERFQQARQWLQTDYQTVHALLFDYATARVSSHKALSEKYTLGSYGSHQAFGAGEILRGLGVSGSGFSGIIKSLPAPQAHQLVDEYLRQFISTHSPCEVGYANTWFKQNRGMNFSTVMNEPERYTPSSAAVSPGKQPGPAPELFEMTLACAILFYGGLFLLHFILPGVVGFIWDHIGGLSIILFVIIGVIGLFLKKVR